jgi:CHASE2 domain-containing sensor protein
MAKFLTYFDVRKFSKKRKIHFAVNLCVGIVIAILFHFIEHTRYGEDLINGAFDFIIRKEALKSAQIRDDFNKKISDKILFVDIDQLTYSKWGSPLITPRDELARIIEAAYTGGARVIVLDILIEGNDCLRPEGDARLRKVLENIINGEKDTKVVVPVRVSNSREILSAYL